MKTALSLLFVMLLSVGSAHAFSVPEIDPSTGAAPLLLLAGAMALVRSRRR